ncbi:histidine phosphatase family protein [Amnibacterium sp. CER49]|uniref:histidine phosphatase family protein n=1 Tax=Amnibacterium sp. CER49 TaxID=3039161 RepID=UPI00244A5AB8|nr:histidine phosphatase family protein [Amnibacterium sp. CER49]MDH2443420.1 histidine phosphatase family protein [Amnibacterium sp. CER49]
MVAAALHLVRHGEVFNPEHVLYGRLPGFRLSARGVLMAAMTARAIADLPVTRVLASPLQRTQESAQPIAEQFGLPIETDERVIEAGNLFEGRVTGRGMIGRELRAVAHLRNPMKPSWGEPYVEIRDRMRQAVLDAFATTAEGHVVIVSHQLPIETVHRSVNGRMLAHDPRNRRTALSSITSFARRDGRVIETAYADPAFPMLSVAVDEGAS